MQKETTLKLFIILLIISLTACNMPERGLSSAEKTALIETAVAKTVAAGDGTTETPSETPDPGTGTAETLPTWTPEPDTPTPSDTPIPCNLARFLTDVSIPDGTVFEPGKVFTKTWRLKNVGSCAWTSGYDLVFAGGDAMSGPSSKQLTSGTVNTGNNLDISVQLTAPSSAGTYRGNWQLRDPSDVIFGVENSSSGLFWVEIKVVVPTDTPAPVTATLHRSSYSKTLSVGGMSSDTRLGIAPNGDALRAFLDFNLGGLAGLSASSTIQSATLNVSNYSGFSCFEFLHPLKAGQIAYGTTPDYPGEFNQAPSATLFSVSDGTGISSSINITSILQNFVEDEGAGHFQFRMELEHDDAGSGFACMMEWPDPLLNITFLP
jgi:hypothetical protein